MTDQQINLPIVTNHGRRSCLKEFIVQAEGLIVTTQYARRKVSILTGVTIRISKSTVFSLIGPSGCGKTTLLRCLVGLVKPSQGKLKIFGSSDPPESRKLGYMPQDFGLFEQLTILETVFYFGHLYSLSDADIKERYDSLANCLQLTNPNQRINQLSGGEKRRVSFICSIIHRPSLLLLDEPGVGCDPLIRSQIQSLINDLKVTYSSTIVITTHCIEEARTSDSIAFMRNGRIIGQGRPDSIISWTQASSLEDAFLKLILSQVDARDKTLSTLDYSTKKSSKSHLRSKFKEKLLSNVTQPIRERFALCKNRAQQPKNQTVNSKLNFSRPKALVLRMYKQYYGPVTPIIGYVTSLALLIFLFACCFGRTPRSIDLGLVVHDSKVTDMLTSSLDARLFNLVWLNSTEEGQKLIRHNDIHGYLIIPELFSDQVVFRYPGSEVFESLPKEGFDYFGRMIYVSNGLNPTVQTVITKNLEAISFSLSANILRGSGLNPDLISPLITNKESIFISPNDSLELFNQVAHYIPRSIFLCSYMVTSMFALIVFRIELSPSTLERAKSTGVTSLQILTTAYIVTLTCPLILSVFTLFIPIYSLQITYPGSYLVGWLLFILSEIGSVNVAFFFATFPFDLTFTYFFLSGFHLIGQTLTGFWWSTTALPYYIRPLSYIHSYYQPTEAFISIVVKNIPLANSLHHFLGSIAFNLIVFLITYKRFAPIK